MRGDREFDEVFDRLFGLAFRHARRLVGNATLAEDLAAEALARTYARWPRVRGYDYIDAWVLRVVTNLAIDALASRSHRVGVADAIAPEDASILRLSLAAALRSLPARQRDAVVLRYFVDMSEADVAQTLGVAPGTVKSHLHRAIASLPAVLGPAFDPRFEEPV